MILYGVQTDGIKPLGLSEQKGPMHILKRCCHSYRYSFEAISMLRENMAVIMKFNLTNIIFLCRNLNS